VRRGRKNEAEQSNRKFSKENRDFLLPDPGLPVLIRIIPGLFAWVFTQRYEFSVIGDAFDK
jgi:hypothetical protein